MSHDNPNDLLYTSSHEWIRREANGVITLGVTHHAQEALGDLVYAETYSVGKRLEAGDTCAVIESVKAASDVYTPVAGTLLAGNPDLAKTPEIINHDPYGKGWLVRIRLEPGSALEGLLDAEAYERLLAEGH
jgi:glycine cleavage system H protein